jgi:hypothetical protein
VNENEFQHLPQDLQDIAHALVAHRDTPDGHLLERVLARVKTAPRPKRGFQGFFRARLAAFSMLLLCLGLNVSGALAAVLSSVGLSSASANSLNLSTLFSSLTKTVSTGNNPQSAADEVYCPENGKGGSDDNSQSGSGDKSGQKSMTTMTSTNGTQNGSDSEKNGGTEDNGGGGGGGQCTPCPTGTTSGSGSGSEQNGPEQNSAPVVSLSKSTPLVTKSKTGIVTTTYTQTTTTTSHNESGGSEQNGGGGQCTPCPPSTSSGSEQNGGSENVQTKVDNYSNGKMVSTTTSNTTKDGDTSGSETNGGSGGCPPPPVEKPGCGNEQNIGISGASGAHGGQPPKLEERGSCPHTPGVDGN